MHSIPLTADVVRGAAELEPLEHGIRPHRLPAWAREQFPDPHLLGVEAQPAGVRLHFRTRATVIELVSHPGRTAYKGLDRPRGAVDVYIDGQLTDRDVLTGGDVVEVDGQSGTAEQHRGAHHETRVSGLTSDEKTVEMWLPHNESLELISLRADASAAPVSTAKTPRWMHYGSSISQGSNATAPSETWPALAARRLSLDLRSMGFGGNGQLDPFAARVIRDSPADVISLKVGINIVNADAMRWRAFVPAMHGFLDTIREGHPTTPLLLISPLHCGLHESTPGPLAIDPEASMNAGALRFIATGSQDDAAQGRLTLTMIREALQEIIERRSASDPYLHHLDGTLLYGTQDAARLPLPDGLHPDAETHRLIGERFVEYAPKVLGPIGSWRSVEEQASGAHRG
jgi:hypothetical protein